MLKVTNRQTCSNRANFPYHRYHYRWVPLLHQTYRRQVKIHSRFTSKHLTLLYIFLSTLLLIIYPSQVACSDDPANNFFNNLFNSSGGGSNVGDGSKRRCESVFNLDLYGCDVVNGCDVMNIMILYGFACLNECVGFGCVYGCTVHYVTLLCRFCNSSCAGYSVF
jgi:hypothetical protein